MKKLMISVATFFVVFFMSENLYSQGNFSLHMGPSFPLSDFGKDDINDEDASGATVGLNLGGKYVYKLNDQGLGVYLGADFNYNGLKSSLKDDIEDQFDVSGADVDIKYYKYINVPITAGLNYTYKANGQVSLFADLGIGADFFKITNMTMEVDNEEIEINFDSSTQLAFKLGGGLLIQDKYIIGLHYNNLGKHNLKSEISYDGTTVDLGDLELKVDILTLTFGMKF